MSEWFWLGCIPTRILVALLARDVVPTLSEEGKTGVSFVAALPALVWLSGALPPETNFAGQEVWWDSYRPVHGLLWGYYAATLDYRSLVADVLFGMYVRVAKKPYV